VPPNPAVDTIIGTLMDPHSSPLDLAMALAAYGEYLKTIPQNPVG
jgi:hypothetical protein